MLSREFAGVGHKDVVLLFAEARPLTVVSLDLTEFVQLSVHVKLENVTTLIWFAKMMKSPTAAVTDPTLRVLRTQILAPL